MFGFLDKLLGNARPQIRYQPRNHNREYVYGVFSYLGNILSNFGRSITRGIDYLYMRLNH